MASMKAMQIHAYGASDLFALEEVARPEPAPGEVLVRIRAVGINPVDNAMRAGYLTGMLGEPPFPIILGWDISGEVVQTGEGVTEFAPGDEVYGLNRFPRLGNAYAEYTTAPVTDIVLKPSILSHLEAAALPLAGLTAWQALFEQLDLQTSERILIQAAAGGVGHLAVQIAHWKGAHVIGIASARNIEFLQSLGAETVIDYTSQPFEEQVQNLDAAIGSMGGDIQGRTMRTLKTGGRLVALLAGVDQELAASYGIKATAFLVRPNRVQLDEISRLVEEGHLKVHVESVFPLQEVAAAHDLIAAHHVRGKVVLEIA